MQHRLIGVVIGAAACLAACGGAQAPGDGKPAAKDAQADARLEARLAAAEKRLDSLEGKAVVSEELVTRVEGHEQRLSEIEQRQAESRRPVPTPPPVAEPRPSQVMSVPVDASDGSEGPKDAWVTMVQGTEYLCPFCDKVRGTLAELRTKYGEDLRIVHKAFVVHQDAWLASQAVCAAHRQKKFVEMDKLLWEEGYGQRNVARDNLLRIAGKVGLNMKRFEKDMDGPCADKVKKDHELLSAVGQNGAPTFFINGRVLVGAMPIDRFIPVIDEELAKAKASGIKKKKYYQHVVETGAKKADKQ